MPRKSLIVSVLVLVAMAAACSEDPKVARQRYLAEGNRYMADKKYTEAVLSYRNAIRADATFGEARLKLAEAYLGAGDGRNALAESVRAADLLPDDSEAQLKAGLLLLLADQFQDARTRATTVLAKDTKNPRALILLGNALAGLKDLDAAVEQVEQAIDENPQLTLSYANLGVLQAARGDMDAAEAALRRAIDVAPNSESAHSALANFLWAAGRRDEAERELEAALKIAPRSAIVNRTIAAIRIT
ncbi:MAG TPA: tetratricopeptide repeat protein, partial [Terriglobia bacterium]|nr:tetratricopeptide repeat protein [Terriglobia bacterium]